MPNNANSSFPTTKRKLLALSGGGIRGLITLEILAEIERGLRDALNRPDLVLADYFDYIGGTGTGGVIGTGLALGYSVEHVNSFFRGNAAAMFDKEILLRRFHYRFEDEDLAHALHDYCAGEDTTLESPRLRTRLLLVLRNAMTGAPWLVTNVPREKFNDPRRADSNLRLPLWKLVKASTVEAAFFPPEVIQLGSYSAAVYGGTATVHTNPAFLLFLRATGAPYGLNFVAASDKLLLVSVGTGYSRTANSNLAPQDISPLYNEIALSAELLAQSATFQDLLCRTFGHCRFGDVLDREVGDMMDAGGPSDRAFTYVRYDPDLAVGSLGALALKDVRPDDIQAPNSIDHMDELAQIGQTFALSAVQVRHLQGFLD
jgi:Patatin-like phospholipase